VHGGSVTGLKRVKKAPFGPYLRSNIPRSALRATLDTYNF
jgi:hypothetical protein